MTESWWCDKGLGFFLCCGSWKLPTVSYSVGCWVGKYPLVSELSNAHVIYTSIFRLQFSVNESCMAVCSRTQFLSMAIPWTYILQGRAATHLRCAGIFNRIFSNHFTVNLLLTQPVKEFVKSVKIWHSYCLEFGGLHFHDHSTEQAVATSLLSASTRKRRLSQR